MYHAQIRRFLVTGAASTAVNYLCFYGLFALGAHYLAASSTGYVAGMVVGYALNRSWTFSVDRPMHGREFALYLLTYGLSLGLNLGALRLLVAIGGISPLVANVAALALSTTTNFLGCKLVVFRGSSRPSLEKSEDHQ